MAGCAGGCTRPPLTKSNHVHSSSNSDVLQVRPGQADVACLAQPTPADGLGMGALDTCARRVLDSERCGLLMVPRRPERLMFDSWLQYQFARLDLAPRALSTGRAG